MSLRDVQRKLNKLGFPVGDADGIYGRRTEAAILKALNELSLHVKPEVQFSAIPDPDDFRVVPKNWMPNVAMDRIILHWSAGAYKMSKASYEHYHLCIEGPVPVLKRGKNSIAANSTIRGSYAAHTRGINTKSIGVSMMCMHGAKENPFSSGKYPMTKAQWDYTVLVVADLCEKYNIEVTPETVLSHAEVQKNLGVKQRNKWDYTRLSFDSNLKGADKIGDLFRFQVKKAMGK